jgi:predicted nucleic acid-binding Zn ribbon protein
MNLKQMLIGKQNADQSEFLKLIKREWSSIVGDSIATKSRPLKLIDNCLTVIADSSSVHNELTLFNTVVTNRIKEKYNLKIADVKVRYNSCKS